FLTAQERRQMPITTGLAESVGEMTTPENLLLQGGLAATGLLPEELAGMVGKGAMGLFTADALRGAYNAIPAVREALDAGDHNEAERILTKAVAPAMLMIASTAAHVAGGKGRAAAPREDFGIEPQREPKLDFSSVPG